LEATRACPRFVPSDVTDMSAAARARLAQEAEGESGRLKQRLSVTSRLPFCMLAEHTRAMGDQRAVLSTVQDGEIWRVQKIWPNGKMDFLGEFSSQGDAIEWIDRHAWWLIESVTEKSTTETSGAA
jgi:hypothetical protein